VLAILFAAGTALVWGSSDYCGGRASRRGNALGVTVVSQLFSVPVLAVMTLVVPGALYGSDFGWGAAAGAAGFVGIVLLYRGLATGAMAVVAPITAVTSAVVPMVIGLVVERVPSALALGGAICAVGAIGLVSLGSSAVPDIASGPGSGPGSAVGSIVDSDVGSDVGSDAGSVVDPAVGSVVDPVGVLGGGSARRRAAPTRRVVGLALSSGVMFGVFLALLAQVHDDSGIWPLVACRAGSILLGLLVIARRGTSLRIPRPLVGWTAAAGIGDIVANGLFVFAARDGLLSVVGPIAALYPVSTVLLALFVDKERVRPMQMAGLGLAAAALVLTAV
jgi:drug/metabolite transporter (DMT)-like permease